MNGQDSQQQQQDAAAASIGMQPPQFHHYKYKYNYRESISISSRHVQLSSSALLDYMDQQYSRLSPFSSIIQDILLRHSALSVHIQVNSQATTHYYDSSQDNPPIMTGPSGVHIKVQFADQIIKANDDASYDQRFLGVLDDLQRHRIVLAPLHAITQHRLHRHIGRTNTTQLEVTMPMEGSSMSSEGLAAFLNQAPCRGIWTLTTPTMYSRTMLQKPATSLWINMRASSRDCFGRGQQRHNKLCRMQHSFGMIYGRGANEVTLSQCLPGTSWKACPLANETTVTLPKAVHYLTTDTDWNAPLWNTPNNGMDPPPVPLYSLHKTVLRPAGMANTGTLQTVVTSNTNVSVAISLLDIIPTTYIRPKWTTLRVDAGTNVTLTTTMDGTMLELLHQGILAPHSTLTVSLDYNPILLNIDSFPADPNRGMEVPPSVLEIAGNTLYSNSLLILPPVPDMSMPYNVISLTCTMYVFLIGSMVNLLVKRASDKVRYAVYPDQVQKSKVHVLRERWVKWRDGMKQRLFVRTAIDMDHKKDQ